MILVSTTHWPDFVLAVGFILVAFVALIGTFLVAGGYIFSNVKDRWAEWPVNKRIKVVAEFVFWAALFLVLLYLSTRQLG